MWTQVAMLLVQIPLQESLTLQCVWFKSSLIKINLEQIGGTECYHALSGGPQTIRSNYLAQVQSTRGIFQAKLELYKWTQLNWQLAYSETGNFIRVRLFDRTYIPITLLKLPGSRKLSGHDNIYIFNGILEWTPIETTHPFMRREFTTLDLDSRLTRNRRKTRSLASRNIAANSILFIYCNSMYERRLMKKDATHHPSPRKTVLSFVCYMLSEKSFFIVKLFVENSIGYKEYDYNFLKHLLRRIGK